jgi:hypothetical protein
MVQLQESSVRVGDSVGNSGQRLSRSSVTP